MQQVYDRLTRKRSNGTRLEDGVANFHLGNGAMLYRLNANADKSKHGMRTSDGYMANYLYEPALMAKRAKAYSDTGHFDVSNLVKSALS